MNALTYTNGYNSLSGWQAWAGYHSGTWYGTTQMFTDGAQWYNPTSQVGSTHTYAFQKVRFDSQDRIKHCLTPDSTGATCRYGWNQSGTGVRYISVLIILLWNVARMSHTHTHTHSHTHTHTHTHTHSGAICVGLGS